MYRLDYKKIKANEKIIDDRGIRELYDSFFIIRLDEDDNNIIGIVKNELCWQSIYHNDDGWDLENGDIPFDYGDTIIYNKETKKIKIYSNYPNDSDIESDTDESTDSETEIS
jgi:hypothetical protein